MIHNEDDRPSALEAEEARLDELKDACPKWPRPLWDFIEFADKIGKADTARMEEEFQDAAALGKALIEIFGTEYCDMLDLPCVVSRGTATWEHVEGYKTVTILYKWVGKDLRIIDINIRYAGDPDKGLGQDDIVNALTSH